jgi:mono/diheme cytochrome c family protein
MDEHDSSPPSAGEASSAPPSEPPPPPPPPPPRKRRPRVRFATRLRTIGGHVYAGILMLVIATVCLIALVYLFRAVFTPASLPPAFSQWQGRLDPAGLRQENVPGVTTAAPRAPMPHYHKVDRWFRPDPLNACTVSGCHSPLPHTSRSPIAAFPNLHVTFLDCAVCHQAGVTGQPIEVVWRGCATGRMQQTPPVLRLTRLLEDLGPTEADAVAAHPKIVVLLKEMNDVAGHEPEMEDPLAEIESSMPNSPFWRKSVQSLQRELPLHVRGDYGAKMARAYTADNPITFARQTRDYLAAPENSAQRKELSRQIHQNVLAKPGACSTCHATEGGSFNFLAAGYSPQRARVLQQLPLARMVERIRAGERFQLPRIMEGGDDD